MRVVDREPEPHLIELLSLIDENRQGWHVLCFAFSRLLEHYRSEYQLKIAMNLMNDLLGDRDGAIYLCDDATVYVAVRHFPKPSLEKMVFQLRYLFMDDPLAYTPDGDENREFFMLYDLETQLQDFTEIVKRRLVTRMRGKPLAQRTRTTEKVVAERRKAVRSMRLFTASSLAEIEHDLREIDLSTTMRRQPVCAAIPETAIRTVFDEMYININHLRQSMGIEIDLLSNRWLFKYLTQMLDARILDAIQQSPARYLSTPISLNLNIPTVLSTRFAEFDAAVKPGSKSSIVIEIQIADVFADIAAFLVAKETVQKMGYRVCLDGVTELSFPQIDRQRLGFDLIKLMWNADNLSDVNSDKNRALEEAIRFCGNNRVILTRCDTKQAVEFGQALGLSLFQGRYLDGVLNPKATVMN